MKAMLLLLLFLAFLMLYRVARISSAFKITVLAHLSCIRSVYEYIPAASVRLCCVVL